MRYTLKTDEGEVVWSGDKRPSQATVDRVCLGIERRGWNGVSLELFKGEKQLPDVFPTDEAKAQYS